MTRAVRRYPAAAGAFGVALLVAGCHRRAPEITPNPMSKAEFGAALNQCAKSGDRLSVPSLRLACVLPEFGGASIDSTGTLNIFVTDLRILPRAKVIVQYELDAERRSQLQFRFIKGDYSYRELESIIRKLLPYLGSGVASVGIDEWVNRLKIAFVTDEARVRLEKAIAELGLARKAIILEKGEYATVL